MTRTRLPAGYTTAAALTLVGVLALAGCAPATSVPAPAEGGAAATTEESREQANPIPPGYGSLHQDAISLSLRAGDLLLKATPLEESVIRLAAPDTYERLRATGASRAEQARAAVYSGEPELLLVSFFSYSPDVEYRVEDIQVMHQGRTLTPVAILPLTAGWGRGRLEQREIQNAVYVFDQDIDYAQPMTVRYGSQESTNWSAIIPVLERERARVRTRTGGEARWEVGGKHTRQSARRQRPAAFAGRLPKTHFSTRIGSRRERA